MQRARAFVQHSIEAPDEDCEGLPNRILEAGASRLPVIATRHAGIPEAVRDGETGFLVEEKDVEGIGVRMMQLLQEPEVADQLGKNAWQYVCSQFTLELSITGPWSILTSCAALRDDDRHAASIKQLVLSSQRLAL